jgi:hypothetical protein
LRKGSQKWYLAALLHGNAERNATMTTQKIGRHAGTGKFTTVQQAKQRSKTHVVETIKRQSPQPAKKSSGK